MAQKLLTLQEAAERLRKTPAALRWMRHVGTGPRSALIGRRIMYLEPELDRWIEEQFDTEVSA